MAVFTSLTTAECSAYFNHSQYGYDLGEVTHLEGILSGIENTNFFVTTQDGSGQKHEWVLTLFEKISAAELPFYLDLKKHLGKANIPVPLPQKNRLGAYFGVLKDRPATLVTKLPGHSIMLPEANECVQMGALLGKMHRAVADFGTAPINPRGVAWRRHVVPLVTPFLSPAQRQLLADEMAQQETFLLAFQALPQQHTHGVVHADAFRNNVMFHKGVLSGIFDFYFSGSDSFLFDLAVVANDWCLSFKNDGNLDVIKLEALLKGYQSERAFLAEEKPLWPAALRIAALRFWLSRLYDYYLPRDAQALIAHEPEVFEQILCQRRSVLSAL